MPEVSVIMSVYNGDRFLAAAVKSILTQTYDDFEFLILDDGSRDGSPAILQAYAGQDPRIRLLSQTNRGLTVSLNHLIEESRGQFLARMDADDVARPDRLGRQVEFLRRHPQVVCVGTGQRWIDQDGLTLLECVPAQDNATLQAQLLAGRTEICHPTAMVRGQAVRAVGGYDPQFRCAQDLDLWLRLGEVGELANLPDLLLDYRVHTDSVSERRTHQQQANVRLACELAWQRRGLEGHYAADHSWRHQFLLQCGWHLFQQGYRHKAIAYGWRAVRAMPLNPAGWNLWRCALTKPLPPSL